MMTRSCMGRLLLAAAIAMTSCGRPKQADLIVYNALVYTVDSAFSTAEAFAVQDGRFIAIGTSDEIRTNYKAAETIDAHGKPVYPGFYDAHAHFTGFAQTFGQADLTGAKSFEEVIDRLKAFRTEYPNTTWLRGRGWDQNLWENQTFPDREKLDEVFPEIPVYLVRIDGHAAIANGRALKLAGIQSPMTVTGGVIEVKNNRLTGMLIDNAMGLVASKIPEYTTADLTKMLHQAETECFAVGLTTVSDAGLNQRNIKLLDSLYLTGALRIRNHAMAGFSEKNLRHYLAKGPYVSERFTVRTFKLFADGALGSRGACLLEPYADAPTSGFLLSSIAAIDSAIARIAASDFQLATHAIGDSANRVILNIYGKYLQGKNDRRWSIEHAQVIAPQDFEKFEAYSIIPSVQPTHATSDMYWAMDRLGPERVKGAYAYRQLLSETGLLALGSDFPVEHINPLYGFHAAIARVDQNGYPNSGFQPENAISREAALRGMTCWAAYAKFEEDKRGSIEVGKKADFVMLAADIMTAPEESLRDIDVLRTAINGETAYQRN
ncbi:amidohydrolase [Parapedobacter lycopersici]|uniref:amidohydrolase n=1 Tax=Parapedobacter lycopersici TaxID=1864939 RepID=UPI00214D2A5C|nr:amidohydrolase family protein [Parapedobacter lycopersici]